MDIDHKQIFHELKRHAAGKTGPAILAIDGRCASGKTTLGKTLAAEWDASLFHMDDFYLQPHQRTSERLAEPGGNIDRERFLAEVLLPLTRGEHVTYRRFNCGTLTFEPAEVIKPKDIAIVEGSYSCHPLLRDYFDLRIFLDIDPEEQIRRIRLRDSSEAVERFRTIWIPLEEAYFNGYRVRETCEIYVNCEK